MQAEAAEDLRHFLEAAERHGAASEAPVPPRQLAGPQPRPSPGLYPASPGAYSPPRQTQPLSAQEDGASGSSSAAAPGGIRYQRATQFSPPREQVRSHGPERTYGENSEREGERERDLGRERGREGFE